MKSEDKMANVNKYCLALFMFFVSQVCLAAQDSIRVPLKNSKGAPIGEAAITQLKQGVKIELNARSLPPGELAFHIHENGKCAGPDFKSAGEHFNPSKNKHGFDISEGPHPGDMPNLIVGKKGTIHTEIINREVTLAGEKHSLLKEGGTALVIHAKADDYKSQPAGDAGDRIACGEIRRQEAS
jgi:Cu-Zn family superoxide dismutase